MNGTTAIAHFGGLGDLVLLAQLVADVRRAAPGERIAILCREPYAAVAELFETPVDRVVTFALDPYATGEPSERAALRALADCNAIDEPIDTLLSPEVRPTWLTYFVLAAVRPGVARVTETPADRPFLEAMLSAAGLAEAPFELVALPEGASARARMSALAPQTALESQAEPERPRLLVPEREMERAAARLSELHLEPGRFLVLFPFGNPATPYKYWPQASFVRLAELAHEKRGLGILAVGAPDESTRLGEFATQLLECGVPCGVAAGEPREVALLAAFFAASCGFAGNDSGPAHLGAAVGRPGVVVYGGGTWPMYAPWARGTIGVVNPLPCFGCWWDCAFDRGWCVESVPVHAVFGALEQALDAPQAEPGVMETSERTDNEQTILAGASERYRAARAREKDTAFAAREAYARAREASAYRSQLAELGAAHAAQAAAHEQLHAQMSAIEREAATQRFAAAERLSALERVSAELERVSAELERLHAGVPFRES